MSAKTFPYIVQAGDYLTAIAYASGTTAEAIWNDPANAKLKSLRKNPEMLAPLDVVMVKSLARTWLSVTVGSSNSFVASPPVIKIHVVLKDGTAKPIAGKIVKIAPKVTPDDPVTGGDGSLSLSVPVTVRELWAYVPDAQARFVLRVGHLDPHDTPSGALSRLRQLGFVGDESGIIARGRPYLDGLNKEATLRLAVAAYQASKNAKITGELDASLQGSLRDDFGC